MLDNEDKLISLAVQGHSEAFGALYDHYQPQIYRFAVIRVGRREEAEDLTHDVFKNAWVNIGKYKKQGFPFSSWLYKIAKNQIVDFYRAKKETTPLEALDEAGIGQIFEAEPLEAKLQIGRVMAAINGLKTEYKDVLALRFIEDLSLKEAAEILGKTEGATKLLQHRALNLLREQFGEQIIEET